MSENYECIIVEKEESFAVIYLNRPPVNAANRKMLEEIHLALDELEKDEQVRSVIITGMGKKAFCAGADLSKITILVKSPERVSGNWDAPW